MEELIPFLSHKMPKLIAATLTAITTIYSQFGARCVDPKPVLKVFPKVFGHADKNVRAEATKLAIELYKWLKDAMKPMFFAELKPVQQKELEEAFEKVKDEQPKRERLLRSEQAAAAAAEAAGNTGAGDEAEEEPEEMDAFDLAEPVDVISKLPENFEEMVASTKWKERKDSLDALFAVINVPRIKDGPYDNIIRALAKCMKDANVAVVTVAANCIEAMAKGLRKGFSKYRSTILPAVLERLKEKKASVVDALAKALDATFEAVCLVLNLSSLVLMSLQSSLTDCLEDIVEFSKNKNPNVKLETIKFLVRCLRTTRDFPSKPEQKTIADTAGKLLTESAAPIRDAASEAMGTLMKILGERAMNPYLEGLDDIRKTKIKEYFETAQVKAKEKPKAAPPPPKPAPAAAPPKKLGARPGLKAPVKKPVASSGYGQQPSSSAPPSTTSSAPKAASKLGGLRLQKKPASAAGSGLSSPSRSKPSPPPLEEEPAAPPPKPRIGLGRGLAGRPLSKEPAQAAAPAQPSAISLAEKAELEELRSERDRWEKLQRDWQMDKQKLTQERNDLQLQNAELIEEQTRSNLAIRAKEAQLVRTRSDCDSALEEVSKQKREIERLKRELLRLSNNRGAASPTPDLPGEMMGSLNGGLASARDPNARSVSRGSDRRLSYASTSFEGDEKENNGDVVGGSAGYSARERMMSPTMSERRADSAMSGRASASGDRIGDWKRAQEVTSQLKLRIEVSDAVSIRLRDIS